VHLESERPILVFGISQRSGTNLLAGLLVCHEMCGLPSDPVREAHLLHAAPTLFDYAERTASRWPERWGDVAEARQDLEASLGLGLLHFLAARTDSPRVVAKTPDVSHLDRAGALLGGSDLLLLVRDGRSVTESLVTGFRYSYGRAARIWRRGARQILELLARADDLERDRDVRIRLVRYEDLVERRDDAMTEILEHCKLDPQGFDWEAARNQPVSGSSFLRDPDTGYVSWRPQAPPPDFDPTSRHSSWGPGEHARFLYVAGREQRELGYDIDGQQLSLGRRALQYLFDAATPMVALRDQGARRIDWFRSNRRKRSGG
jgi:hypothetical protein